VLAAVAAEMHRGAGMVAAVEAEAKECLREVRCGCGGGMVGSIIARTD
jgi:hypothetical protein